MTTKNSKTPAPVDETATPVDMAPVLVLVESAVSEWRESLDHAARSIESAAVAAFAASPFIGERQHWANGEAYRSAFPAPRPDKAGNIVPVSASTLTLWTLLGKAHSLGITPDDEAKTWKRLVQRATDKRISKAIRDDAATKAKIVRAVNGCYPKGQYAAEVKADTPEATPDATHGNTVPASEEEANNVPNSVPAALALAEACLSYVAKQRESGVTPAESEHVSTMLAILDGLKVTRADEAA